MTNFVVQSHHETALQNRGHYGDGLHNPNSESAVASEISNDTTHDYANWGGEFVDDALRFGEQLVQQNVRLGSYEF